MEKVHLSKDAESSTIVGVSETSLIVEYTKDTVTYGKEKNTIVYTSKNVKHDFLLMDIGSINYGREKIQIEKSNPLFKRSLLAVGLILIALAVILKVIEIDVFYLPIPFGVGVLIYLLLIKPITTITSGSYLEIEDNRKKELVKFSISNETEIFEVIDKLVLYIREKQKPYFKSREILKEEQEFVSERTSIEKTNELNIKFSDLTEI
jgi:hypothetical protein